jgi:large subunit ribosomal protein L35Ae
MKAIIVNFRKSRHVQKDNHMILEVEGVEDKEKARALVGKSVTWKSPANKEIKGKVASSHGNKGAVRVIFETGMPGQAVGSEVEIQ